VHPRGPLVILLSLALIVASAVTLTWGLFAGNDPLVWVSLAAGLGAVALIAGSVVRHRRNLLTDGVPDAGPATAGPAAVGSASAGVDPAPSPTPYRAAPAPPAGPVSPPGTWTGAQSWPWATPPPGGTPDAGPRSGWTGPVSAADPPPAAPAAPAPPTADTPAASAWADATAPPATAPPATAPPATAPPATVERVAEPPPEVESAEPGIEQIAVRDALRVAQLQDEVVVVDGYPRYHLAECPTLTDAQPVPLAVSVARRGGFTPCARCRPDATLLARARARAEQRAQQKAPDGTAERPSDGSQQL
jgi:hypothetical protein